MSKYFDKDPIIVGGIGGSGTRVVAEIIKATGIFIGSNLNEAYDNLTLAKQFPNFRDSIQKKGSYYNRLKRKFNNYKKLGVVSTSGLISKSLCDFENEMFTDWNSQKEVSAGWGWKIPGNFFIMEQLSLQYPKMKYIHTIRNGFDMAFSNNHNQLYNWGKHYGVDITKMSLSKASFEYWYKANSKAIMQANRLFEDRFLLVQFEELCQNPEKEINKIIGFLGIENVSIPSLMKLVKVQPTTGRFKKQDLRVFNDSDVRKLNELGYHTE